MNCLLFHKLSFPAASHPFYCNTLAILRIQKYNIQAYIFVDFRKVMEFIAAPFCGNNYCIPLFSAISIKIADYMIFTNCLIITLSKPEM